VGHEDDLESVAELAVGGLAERLFEAVGLSLGQTDADHGCSGSEGQWVHLLSLRPDSIIGSVDEKNRPHNLVVSYGI
jgi:hypothetical protein